MPKRQNDNCKQDAERMLAEAERHYKRAMQCAGYSAAYDYGQEVRVLSGLLGQEFTPLPGGLRICATDRLHQRSAITGETLKEELAGAATPLTRMKVLIDRLEALGEARLATLFDWCLRELRATDCKACGGTGWADVDAMLLCPNCQRMEGEDAT